jgi:hypothetical protein
VRQVLSAHRLRAHAYKRQLRGFLCGEVTAKTLLDELVSTHTITHYKAERKEGVQALANSNTREREDSVTRHRP